MHLELPIVSFLCAVLVLAPLPWHWRSGMVPTISISIWMFLANIINGVNTSVWADNVIIKVPVWCDIVTKLMMGMNVSLPASVFCLCMHLERVSSLRQCQTTHKDKRRRQIIDVLLCVGYPLIYMALHYIVQGHRFDLIEGYGCRPTEYNSIPDIVLIWIPPLGFSVAAGVLSVMSLRNFFIRRLSFARHLANANSALTTSRYLRLMAMAMTQIFWTVVITSINMWFRFRAGMRPWISWANVHSNWSRIAQFPTILIPADTLRYTYIFWWAVPISSVMFFIFFAFGADAVKEYKYVFSWIRRTIFRIPDSATGFGKKNILPSFVQHRNSTSKVDVPQSSWPPSDMSSLPPYQYSNSTPKEPSSELQSNSTWSARGKAIGSLTEFSVYSADSSTEIPCPYTPTPPSLVFVSQFPVRDMNITQSRPFTYPSLDASHRLIQDNGR